ncbi:uncharacterized protein [Primulina huaijiensis]|uniref:uncharacterized protein n=1 Tax=Primulina huaijiensis TaxID=1492673 RepID=UPI003CC70C69
MYGSRLKEKTRITSTSPQPRDYITWALLFSPPHHVASGCTEVPSFFSFPPLPLFPSPWFSCSPSCSEQSPAKKGLPRVSLPSFFFQLLGVTCAGLLSPFYSLRATSSKKDSAILDCCSGVAVLRRWGKVPLGFTASTEMELRYITDK